MTPFLKEAFPELKSQKLSDQQLTEYGTSYISKQREITRQKLLNYIKNSDAETALNAMFVLHDNKDSNLPQICQRMGIDKAMLV